MSKDRAVRQEIKDRISALPNFKGDVDKECIDLVELMRAAEISPESSYWTDYNTALQARHIIPKVEQPKPTLASLGIIYTPPATNNTPKPAQAQPKTEPATIYTGNKFLGRAHNTMVAIKRSPNCVWISETYAGIQTHKARIRVNWGYASIDRAYCAPQFCAAEITDLEHNFETNLFITTSDTHGSLFYKPLSHEDLETICEGLSRESITTQATKIVNFGFSVCKMIYDGLRTGDYKEVPQCPLSAVKNDKTCWAAITLNKENRATLRFRTIVDGKHVFGITYDNPTGSAPCQRQERLI